MTNLDDLTRELGEAYDKHKEAEKLFKGEDKKKKDRKRGLNEDFFDAATEEVAKRTLAQKTVVVPDDVPDPLSYAQKRNPRWEVVKVAGPNKRWVVMQENPAYKNFTYVNKETQRAFSKSVADKGVVVDDEALRERDPDLWKRVTQIANYDFIAELLYHANVDVDEIDERIADIEKSTPAERRLLPLEELSADDLTGVQEYMYVQQVVVSLKVRDATKEELNEDDN